MNTLRNVEKFVFACIFSKFKYLVKKFILTESSDHMLKMIYSMFIFWRHWGVILGKLLIKSRNQNIFEKFKLN